MLSNIWHSIAQVISHKLNRLLNKSTIASDEDFKKLLALRGGEALIIRVDRIDETRRVGVIRRIRQATKVLFNEEENNKA